VNPAFSVVFFTTLAGAAQGLVVFTALAALLGAQPLPAGFRSAALLLALALALGGLAASFLHLGRPERAWRAAMMWRTSWLSREVIVLPAFVAWVALWWWHGSDPAWLGLGAVVLAGLLWYCTAMIYACLRFVQEWAHPLTLVNFTLIGLSSGGLLYTALAAGLGEAALLQAAAPWALAATLAAWATRVLALRRNAGLRPKSTLQSATGIAAPRLAQQAMGMTGGAFNTREFFHGKTPALLRRLRFSFLLLGFALPAALVAWGWLASAALPWLLAWPLQYAGLLAERWFFFAQARHPQNLYYQVVS
jgi:DMSO reductase anchor subunit